MEFAAIAPVLVLLVFGMFECGRMVQIQKTLTHAARQGARRAAMAGATSTEVNSIVDHHLASANLKGATVTIHPTEPEQTRGPVTVSLSIPFGSVSWLPAPLLLGNTNLTAHGVTRRGSKRSDGS